jgi:hypothetical protein
VIEIVNKGLNHLNGVYSGVTRHNIKTPEGGHLGPKHVLKVKVEEKGTICCITDELCYT